MITVGKMTVDYETSPIGIDNARPAFSWQLQSNRRGEYQTAYRVLVSVSREGLERVIGDCWDSGRVESRDSQHIAYGGCELRSETRYYWKTKVWDRDGNESEWSDTGYWEMGLLRQEEWTGRWITAPFLPEPQPEPDLLKGVPVLWDRAVNAEETAGAKKADAESGSGSGTGEKSGDDRGKRYFRLVFEIGDEGLPAEAKLHVFAADSLYIYVNEHDEGLYYPYLQSVVLDVAGLLRQGRNVVACAADGERPGLVATLRLTYPDGSVRTYGGEGDWLASDSPQEDWTSPDSTGEGAGWRAPAKIGAFGEGDWSVYKRIHYPVNTAYGPCPVLGRAFRVEKPVAGARLYISALGIYQSRMNGVPIGNDVFAPGWTDYRTRIPYQVYDVASMLREGDNTLEADVGSGWYAGHLGICGPYHYGKKVACRAQLRIDYADGTSETIGTDEEWYAALSPIVSADIYMGETYDARLERASFASAPELQSTAFFEEGPGGRMTAQQGPAIRAVDELAPRSVRRVGEGRYIVDMGQNMVGWLRLKVTGAESGRTITLRYAERLEREDRLYRVNLRTAKQTDVYIARGAAEEQYEPRFTYHGFQYVEIEGYPDGELTTDRIAGIVVRSTAEETSEVHTSHALLNRLMDNVKWSQRGNFFGVPLDCPQRDERLGWTGDAHAFARTATYNMNCASFYGKWMADIRDAQGEDGAMPDVAPFVEHFGRGHVFFADGGVILPWTLYRVYGDKRTIESNYEAMARWIVWMENDSDENLVRRSESFGDHLSFGAETPRALINAAFFAYSVRLMARMAGEIGREEDAVRYEELFEGLKRSFQARFVREDGLVESETQTAYVLALMIGLLPKEMERAALRRLVDNIRQRDWHMTTGFMGVSYILPLLSEYGETATAYRLLLQETFPSWLYPVMNGATTIWERWDGWNEERGFQDPEMNSFNHYALGSVGEWIYRYLVGIDLDDQEAGFRSFRIRPLPGGGISSAACRYDSLYGRIESDWSIADDGLSLRVEVPANTSAELRLPAQADAEIRIDGMPIVAHAQDDDAARDGWTFIRRDVWAAYFRIGSGRYEFKVATW
ncbi:family 78 glycoside hydrolase catalytic domain [Paenibacillus nasutitermitis]|uniref:alpha-L-rhamnosidase n=1 Tax=Paenibacillus nasutitermitis TaxID=1652958 RepID=A0A916Z9G9_9BACL|nr:family 78 glycoside hydrolase catalytic domain [Paenibacillus nasutitermitis]GGD82356.1 rhamnosidase [Paenibacillus nasutitermitis]